MFKIIRATRRGNRIARESSVLTMETVNNLLNSGVVVRAPDTFFIVREAFALYSSMSLATWMEDLHRGQMVVHASEITKDWFDKVSLAHATPTERAESEATLSGELVCYWKEWLNELMLGNDELAGSIEFREPAIAQLVSRLDAFLESRFAELNSDLRKTILDRVVSMARSFNP